MRSAAALEPDTHVEVERRMRRDDHLARLGERGVMAHVLRLRVRRAYVDPDFSAFVEIAHAQGSGSNSKARRWLLLDGSSVGSANRRTHPPHVHYDGAEHLAS